ncbi:MAG: hypothetical protein P1V81_02005 [Planctomycetota bacterium]|nr:hypothetical protein [Planctomycetota bacterium]
MRSLLVTLVLLVVAGAIGLGAAWYVRPEWSLDPAQGPGFDPDAVGTKPRDLAHRTEAEILAAKQAAAAQAKKAVDEAWVARNNAALQALDAGDLPEALVELRACFEHDPDNDTYRRNLVEVLARYARGLWEQGDRDDAILDLEEAIELAAGLPMGEQRGDLKQLLERWNREHSVEADFYQDTSQHFELSYDTRHEDLVTGYQDVLDLLEDSYADLRDVFGADPVFDTGRRYRVVLYRRETFEQVTGLHSWAGGAFDGTIRLPVRNLAVELHGMKPLLKHELVHAFVEAVGGKAVPGWFNEGLAQYLSGEREVGLERAASILSTGFVTLDELGGSFARWTDRTKVAKAYSQSLVLVDGIGGRYGDRILVELCAAAREGGNQGILDHFEQVSAWSLLELQEELAASYVDATD